MSSPLTIRQATEKDHQEIANLMFFERHVHRHLDWRHPTDWLGLPFYWVLERNKHIMAVLACPQDQKDITWIRLFAHVGQISAEESWEILWEHAQKALSQYGDFKVAAISLQNWMKALLQEHGFRNDEQIVMMAWKEKHLQDWGMPKGIHIRDMKAADLPVVARVDEAAFLPLWQNSLSMLKQAFPQAVIATVAEAAGEIVGYQFSTGSPYGVHLARLATHPKMQRRGVASALLGDLTTKIVEKKFDQLSVNTQSHNYRSIALYKKCGFHATGEEYPLYTYDIEQKKQRSIEKEIIKWDTVRMQS